ncbi:hypothetical protein LQW54_007185 [Pestalotiopsis sp. IQ-011]
MAGEQKQLLKVSVLHYRDESHDEETWTKWYYEEQIPRFVPVANSHGIDRVELYITPKTLREYFQKDLDELKGGCATGWQMAPYDAATIYWVTDPQKIRDMLNDKIWQEKVTPFEKGWIKQNRVDVQAGYQTTFVEDGKIINTTPKSYD